MGSSFKQRSALALLFAVIGLIPISAYSNPQSDFVLDETSRELAYCGDVFAYAINYFLINNNEGASKVMVFQQARATVAVMFMNVVNDRVPAERMKAISLAGRGAKPYLDANPEKLGLLIDGCTSITTDAARLQRGSKLWGKDFYQAVEDVAAQLRAALGL